MRAAAETFRPNPALDTEAVITELGVGEALISFLGEDGVPAIVDRALVAIEEGRRAVRQVRVDGDVRALVEVGRVLPGAGLIRREPHAPHVADTHPGAVTVEEAGHDVLLAGGPLDGIRSLQETLERSASYSCSAPCFVRLGRK